MVQALPSFLLDLGVDLLDGVHDLDAPAQAGDPSFHGYQAVLAAIIVHKGTGGPVSGFHRVERLHMSTDRDIGAGGDHLELGEREGIVVGAKP